MRIDGKCVVVTGAAERHRCRARAAVRGGRRARCRGRRRAEGRRSTAVAREIGDSLAVQCDVTDEAQLRALVDAAEDRFGPIDLFCSNAGIVVPGGADASDEIWRRSIDVNVMAHVYAARIMVPRMIERGGGYLLQTASAAGLLTQIGSAPYSVTKHAALALAEWLAITYGEQGHQGVGARTAGRAHRDDRGHRRRRRRRRRRHARARRRRRRGRARARGRGVPHPPASPGVGVLPAQGVRLRPLDRRGCSGCKHASAIRFRFAT